LHASLQSTNYRNIQILFFDDCSDDGSLDQIAKFSEKYLAQWNYTLFQSSQNMGQAFGRAYLLEQIGPTDAPCVFLDMDDEVSPELVRRLLAEYAHNPDTQITLGSWKFNDKARRAFPLQTSGEIARREYLQPPF